MAGALGVRLSGPRQYEGGMSDEPWVNENGRDVEPDDVMRALVIFKRTMYATAAILAILAII